MSLPADLPLHYGNCPRWLFDKMKRLARATIECIVLEKGPEAFLKKLADPYFFQSLGCMLLLLTGIPPA